MTHLLWLQENKPAYLAHLAKDVDALRTYLKNKSQQALRVGAELEKKGMAPHEIEEYELMIVAPPDGPATSDNPPEPMDEDAFGAILQSLEAETIG